MGCYIHWKTGVQARKELTHCVESLPEDETQGFEVTPRAGKQMWGIILAKE